MITFPSFASLEEAWVEVLRAAEAMSDGRLLHAVLAISNPGAPDAAIVTANDALLTARGDHSVDTVANTLFPANLYAAPDYDYGPTLTPDELRELDEAADELYLTYKDMLPILCGFDGNRSGTYFGRLVSWPGKSSDGYNQLAKRIEQLRYQRSRGNTASNAADFALEGIAELASSTDEATATGLQVYKSDDERLQAFPCLVHIDLSVVNGRLSLLAVYRHWHLVHKAYGNLIGLTRLLHFLCQQTGYELGELMIHATVANAEVKRFGHQRLKTLISSCEPNLGMNQELVG